MYLEYGGSSIVSRSNLLNDILNSVNDLVILTAQGYAQIVLFRDNAVATLKMTKYENDLEIALRKVAKAVSKESCEFQYSRHAYKRRLSKSIAREAVSETILKLLSKISPKLNEDSLTSLLIGNIITCNVKKHPIPLQIALGLLIKTHNQILNHLFDNSITCNYDEVRRFRKSAAIATVINACESCPVGYMFKALSK